MDETSQLFPLVDDPAIFYGFDIDDRHESIFDKVRNEDCELFERA